MFNAIALFNALSSTGNHRPCRRPLYARVTHWLNRIANTAMLAMPCIALVLATGTSPPQERGLNAIVCLLFLLLVSAFVSPYLRTSALYGSPAGLEIARWGKRRIVPWSKVGRVELAPTYLGHFVRMAHLTVYEAEERTVSFFATEALVAELEKARAAYRESA
jgi:membrane protein YdbS with pleckstrin-like domain